jgi:hypothetical protein
MAATVPRLGRATEAVQDSMGEDPRERRGHGGTYDPGRAHGS